MVTNIRYCDVKLGDVVMDYMRPAPARGRHRYVLLLLQQPEGKVIHVRPPASRSNFSCHDFALAFQLGVPVAATYFTCSAEQVTHARSLTSYLP